MHATDVRQSCQYPVMSFGVSFPGLWNEFLVETSSRDSSFQDAGSNFISNRRLLCFLPFMVQFTMSPSLLCKHSKTIFLCSWGVFVGIKIEQVRILSIQGGWLCISLPRAPGGIVRPWNNCLMFPRVNQENGLACLALLRMHTQKNAPVCKIRT